MALTDPIADLLTRIRNANSTGKKTVDVPASKAKHAIAEILRREGYIGEVKKMEGPRGGALRINLRYGRKGEKVLTHIVRVSKPGCRIYRGVETLGKVLDGLGVAIVSTPKGLMTDRECRKLQVGGEVICKVW